MNIRAKVKCSVASKPEGLDYESVTLEAVYEDGNEENKSFAEATPSLQLNMSITNKDAQGQFKVGSFYYLDFVPME